MGLSLQTMIIEIPEYTGHYQSTGHIDYRMLFQEHGGEDDQNSQEQGTPSDKVFFLEIIAVPDGNAGCYRIKYMNAWKYIRGSIGCVESLHNRSQEVISWKYLRTQLQSIWPYPGDEKKDRHTRTEIDAISVKFSGTHRTEGEPDQEHGDINKPEIIRDDKPFTERNHLVDRR